MALIQNIVERLEFIWPHITVTGYDLRAFCLQTNIQNADTPLELFCNTGVVAGIWRLYHFLNAAESCVPGILMPDKRVKLLIANIHLLLSSAAENFKPRLFNEETCPVIGFIRKTDRIDT